ncbi:hypothetical protein [Burkholderia plantarii]|uniref:hypothetical protein n=1 Tax=Burkholderia plantarii TaxID=41899 RepID=UPI0018DB5B19|nr:hypothetical protein [Burkholderia plantarii]
MDMSDQSATAVAARNERDEHGWKTSGKHIGKPPRGRGTRHYRRHDAPRGEMAGISQQGEARGLTHPACVENAQRSAKRAAPSRTGCRFVAAAAHTASPFGPNGIPPTAPRRFPNGRYSRPPRPIRHTV